MTKRTEVVVIGAGAAGLAAARSLLARGIGVVLLEARERCGGRIDTRHVPGLAVPIELGAEFIHGRAEEVVALAAEAGLTAYDIHGLRFRKARTRLLPVGDFWSRLERVMSLLHVEGRDRSFQEFLDERPGGRRLARERRLAAQYVAGFHAADLERVSAHALATEGSPEGDAREARTGRLLEGYGALIEHLASGLQPQLRLGRVVRHVEWEPGRASVETRGAHGSRSERIEARAVLVTVPLGVLQAPPSAAGAIAFTPALLAKQDALAGLAMGSVVRVTLRLSERFWTTERMARRLGDEGLDRLSFLHGNDPELPVWWTSYPLQAPILVGWAGGARARQLAAQGRSAVEAAALRALAGQFRLTGRRAAALVEDLWTHDWQRDPYARGAYSYPAVGGVDAATQLARPLQSTLFFAGEATDTLGANATVHGALASGYRAARQIERALQRGPRGRAGRRAGRSIGQRQRR